MDEFAPWIFGQFRGFGGSVHHAAEEYFGKFHHGCTKINEWDYVDVVWRDGARGFLKQYLVSVSGGCCCCCCCIVVLWYWCDGWRIILALTCGFLWCVLIIVPVWITSIFTRSWSMRGEGKSLGVVGIASTKAWVKRKDDWPEQNEKPPTPKKPPPRTKSERLAKKK